MKGQLIYEHGKDPSNYGRLQSPTFSHTEKNTSCGESLTVDLLVEAGKIKKIAFEAECRIVGVAAMSLLTDELIGEDFRIIEEFSLADIYDLLEIEELTEKRKKSALLGLLALKNLVRKANNQNLIQVEDLL